MLNLQYFPDYPEWETSSDFLEALDLAEENDSRQIVDHDAEASIYKFVGNHWMKVRAKAVLVEKEFQVISLIYFEDYQPGEVAYRLGISFARVSQLNKSAIKKLHPIFNCNK